MPGDRPTKATVSHEREVVTYSWLWHASRTTLQIGQSGVDGAAWQRMSSILLTAFSVEAFLNHFGTSFIADWPKLERRLPPLVKLARLAHELGTVLGPPSERPMSTVGDVFSFRNSLAHGRTEFLKPDDVLMSLDEDIDHHLVHRAPLTDWEAKIRTDDFAMLARADVERIFTRLYEAMPEPKDALFGTGIHMSAASTVV